MFTPVWDPVNRLHAKITLCILYSRMKWPVMPMYDLVLLLVQASTVSVMDDVWDRSDVTMETSLAVESSEAVECC